MDKIIKTYIIYWSVFCLLVGVLIAPLFYKKEAEPTEDHSGHYNHEHQASHGKLEVNSDNAPHIAIEVVKDEKWGWNLQVTTHNFRFTPLKINQKNEPNQGHAHIYINGNKLTRLYGHHYHLSEMPAGKYEIKVSLNANDHSALTLNDQPIIATTHIVQPAINSN